MHTFVALLRGINVGKAKRVAMADLRILLRELGFTEVKTLLNSGNAVFRAESAPSALLAQRIEQGIVDRFGFSARVTVLCSTELRQIIDEDPMGEAATDPSRYLVGVLQDAADIALLQPLLSRDWSPERILPGTRVVYLWCARGILESGMLELVSKRFGDRVTTRNWSTIKKLQAMC